jgi:hypothetical protein
VTSADTGPDTEHKLPCPADPAAFRDAVHAYVLAESGRHDTWLRRLLAAERSGYDSGRADGRTEGWAAAEADMAAAWHAVAYPVAQPEAHAREVAGRCLRAAEAGERRDAAEHERAFVARAYNTRADQRTDVQAAAVQLYPPPSGRKARAA